MFWFKKKKKLLKTTTTSIDKVIHPNSNLNALTLRRNILDWRDKQIINIELNLRRETKSLMQAIEHELGKLTVIESTFKMKKIHTKIIQPLITEWTKRESRNLLDDAQKELFLIHGLVLEHVEHDAFIDEHESNAHFIDAAKAASVGLSGIVAIPAFASASAVSTTGMLGLLGVTTLSLPIAATGILVIGTLLALCGFKMSFIKEKAVKRYLDQLHSSIKESVLGDENNGKPSLSGQLQKHISTASNFILDEITQ